MRLISFIISHYLFPTLTRSPKTLLPLRTQCLLCCRPYRFSRLLTLCWCRTVPLSSVSVRGIWRARLVVLLCRFVRAEHSHSLSTSYDSFASLGSMEGVRGGDE